MSVSVYALKEWLSTLFAALGLTPQAAGDVSANIAEAERRGVRSHGLLLVPIYADRILRGGIDVHAQVEVLCEFGGLALLDGHGGVGQTAALFGARLAVRKAQTFGVGLVNIQNNNHIGHLASYGLELISAGCAGLVFTNAGPSLAAYGGNSAALGNNALCFAFPNNIQPLIIDMAVGAAACGKVRVAALDGQQLTDSWLIDRDGLPTTDPSALDAGGAMTPSGGHKGYALAVAIDAFTAAIGGGPLSPQVRRQRREPDACQRVSQTILAVDLHSLGTSESLPTALDGFVNSLRALRPSQQHDEVMAPGDPELRAAAKHDLEGVDVPRALVDELNRLAGAQGIPLLEA